MTDKTQHRDQTPCQSAFLDAGGPRLHYLEWLCSGPPVLCLPGITSNAHAFAGLAEELSSRYRVLAMDLRGRGESEKPARGYDVGTHVGDIGGFLNRLEIGRAAVIGWSLGAKVALALAALQPERVERLVLIDPPVKTPPAAVAALQTFWARLDNTYASVEEFLDRMQASGVFKQWDAYAEDYLRADVEVCDGVVRHRVPRHVPTEELAAEDAYPTRSFYRRVTCPTLVLRAPRPLMHEGDQVVDAEQAQEMVSSLANCRLIEVEGADHFSVLLGKPRQTLDAIEAFLGTRSGAQML